MLRGAEDNQLTYMGFVCASHCLTCSVPSSTGNIKIALSFLFSYALAFALPPAYTTCVFTQIHLPDRVHPVVAQTAVLGQPAGERGGKNKHRGAYEASMDYFGTAAELNLVKLWHSVPWSYR